MENKLKQKQIEEMADLMSGCVNCRAYDEMHPKCQFFIQNELNATKLYNAGYRKIQGAVVLTAEQFSDYLTLKDRHKNAVERCEKLQELKGDYVKGYEAGVDEGWDNASEETAEELDKWKRKAIFYYGLAKESGIYCVVDDEICKEITENGETITGHIPHWATCPQFKNFKKEGSK